MMEQKLRPARFVFAALVALSTLLSASVILPHDRYYRFQAYDNVTTRKADWIYERLHFDLTPVDVALIGTSRTGGGLSGPQIEHAYCEAVGRRIHVANLALPQTGRNMHYVLAREAAETKAPALTVIEINDVETRKPHSGFIFLADARDIITAPAAINFNFFADLARLPGRQASLFAQTILGQPALRERFEAESYAGANLDLTEVQIFVDGQKRSRRVSHSRQDMNAMRAARLNGVSPTYMAPEPLRSLEYRFARAYFDKIESVTAKHQGAVAYAYAPAYGEPSAPSALLDALGVERLAFDLGGELAGDHTKWLDATHLNAGGAALASLLFAAQLAETYPALGVEGACG